MKKAKLVLLILMVLLAIAGLVVTFKPLMIEENGRTLLIAPHAQKDFKSHEVPDPVYAGSSSLEINSLRLCSLVAKLHGWDRERTLNCTHKNGQEEKQESKKQDKSGF